jgi:adenylosuccinate lyase|tara:strand:- start:485 stop:1834 length:1350 start_codon:yes stop_codon:yes gene_type:complete
VYSRLGAISPLDGRYGESVKVLSPYFSEAALMRYRLYIEIEYLIALSNEKEIKELDAFSNNEQAKLRSIYQKFDAVAAERIKELEINTNHDVKAVEYYIQEKTKKSLHPWIHFALTSEDVNNLSYSLMWKHGLDQIYFPELKSVLKGLKKLAKKYKNASMLSLTHGQSATPTTFGKELAVFCIRLERQLSKIKAHRLLGKFGGATGTWSAHLAAYPKVDWVKFTTRFIKSCGLEPNLITTQIESHDSLAESYQQMIRVNSILNDLCKDMWFYISRGILSQKRIKGEVGSSTMPHKINPIQFENAEGNIGIANSLLGYLSEKLPVSRMQRDLTDSTSLRNQGVALAHSYLSLKSISSGLNRITINKLKMNNELNDHWEVLAEAIQTVLRKSGQEDAYEKLKNLTQGQSINSTLIKNFVSDLKIPEKDKETLFSLNPENYTGLSSKLVDLL